MQKIFSKLGIIAVVLYLGLVFLIEYSVAFPADLINGVQRLLIIPEALILPSRFNVLGLPSLLGGVYDSIYYTTSASLDHYRNEIIIYIILVIINALIIYGIFWKIEKIKKIKYASTHQRII
jgi:hypothetical protein